MPELLVKGAGWLALAVILAFLWLVWMNRDKLPKNAPASATARPTPAAPAAGHGTVAHASDHHATEEAEGAPAPAAPHPPAPAGGHGQSSHGGASGALGWLLLAIVLGILALVYVGKKAGFGVIPGVGGSASSSAHVSRIPVSACSVPPADAAVVLAPVDGCSRAFSVPSHSYGCVDPGPSSGLVRGKSWYEGNPEPSTWNNGRTRGNKQCFGSAGSTPVTIRVWTEPQGSS